MADTPNQSDKKLKKAHIIILASVLIAFFAYGYYEVVFKAKLNGATLIDNPTGNTITVTIDSEDYTVPANAYIKVDLEEGKHSISCKNYNISKQDLILEPTIYGVINPTKSKYVIYNIIYTNKDLKNQYKPYQVEGKEIYSLLGAPTVTTDLFVPDRTLGKGNIDNTEPSSETYNKMNQDYAYLTKIFRLKDFFDFYDKNNK